MRITRILNRFKASWMLAIATALACLLQALPLFAAPAPIDITPAFHDQALAGAVSASARQSHFASAAEALAAFRGRQFHALPGNLARGYLAGEVWLAFDLRNIDDAAEFLVLEVGPPFLDVVTVFQTAPDGSLQSRGSAGDQIPRNQARVVARQPSFVLNLRGNPHSTVLVHISSASTMAAIMRLYRPLAFQEAVGTESLVLGGILMLNAIMVLVALGLYLLMRQPIYLAWLLFVACTATLWFFMDGLAYRYLPLPATEIINGATALLSIGGIAAWTLFITVAFDFKSISIWLHRLFAGWAAIVAGCIPLLAFVSYQQVTARLMLSGGPILLISSCVIALQILRGNREAVLHGPLFLVYLAAAAYNVAANLGWTEYCNESLYGWQVAGMLNFLSLQVSIYKRARQTQRDHEKERAHLMNLLSAENLQLEEKIRARTQDLERALKEVEKAESDQRQLLSMASHEFRTPAAMIKASLDSLTFLRDAIHPDVAQRLGNIGKASVRLNNLANSLISHDRVQELSIRPRKSDGDLCQLVSGVINNYAAEAALVERLPADPVRISFDPVLITIALHNLVDNALRHNDPAAGAVTIGLSAADGRVELHVADHGSGIPDADKEGVFERFFSSRGGPSNGLGLSIVQTIARSHGGSAFALDNHPQGTVMVISLPLLPPKPQNR